METGSVRLWYLIKLDIIVLFSDVLVCIKENEILRGFYVIVEGEVEYEGYEVFNIE